jgi:hypothetical protein
MGRLAGRLSVRYTVTSSVPRTRLQQAFGASTSTARFDLPYGNSVANGVFTAKATGVYMFFMQLRLQDLSISEVELQWTINDIDQESFEMCVRACLAVGGLHD